MNYYVYLVHLFDKNSNLCFTKIGKTNNVERRLKELERYYYISFGVRVGYAQLITTYEFLNEESALAFEALAKLQLKKTHEFCGGDRFKPFTPNDEDLKTLFYLCSTLNKME